MSTTSAPAPALHRPDGQIPALSVEAITKSFNANVMLTDFNLELMPGSVHALPGHNGSGKSTFIRILSGRFNVVGPVIALLIIAVGVNGLHLVGLPFWVTKTFQGVALLVAVILGRVRTKLRPIGPS